MSIESVTQPAPSRARTLEAGQSLGRLAQHRAASRPGALCYRAWAQSWSSAGVEAHSVLPSQRPLPVSQVSRHYPVATVVEFVYFTVVS